MKPIIIILATKPVDMQNCANLFIYNHPNEYTITHCATCEEAMKAILEKPGEKILLYYIHHKEEGINELAHVISSEWVVPVFITKKEKNELKAHPPDSITIHGELTKANLVDVLKEARNIFSNRAVQSVAAKSRGIAKHKYIERL